MKRVLFVILLGCAALTASAQTSGRPSPIRFGVKGGINSQSMTLTPINGNNGDYRISPSDNVGYHMGIYARIKLPFLSLRPEILYTVNSFDIKAESVNSDQNPKNVSAKVRIKNIEFPILADFSFLFLRLNAGPVFNLMSSSKVADGSSAYTTSIQKPTVGFALGIGFTLRDIDLDLRYRGEFTKTKYSMGVGDNFSGDYRGKFNGWSLSLGYLF